MPVVESVAVKLLSTALARAGSTLFQKLLRLRKIDISLRGNILKDKTVETAIADFETVVGSYRGELTVSLHNFLGELQGTGLLTVIADEAIVQRRDPTTKAAFVVLHEQIVGNQNRAPELYEQLAKSFEITLQNLMLDQTVAYLIRTSSNQIQSQLKTIHDRMD